MKKISDVVVCFVIFVLIIGMDRVAPESRENSALLPFLKTRNQNERNIIMLTEQWKPIKGYEGLYEISNFGKIKALSKTWYGNNNARKVYVEIIMKQKINPQGYFMIGLSKSNIQKWFNIHNLVWDNFSDIPRNGYKLQIDHIDNNKLNNRFDNLQLLSNRQNTSKGMLQKPGKTSKYIGVSWDKSRNKWVVQIQINHKSIHLGRYENENIAAQVYQNALEKYETA